MPDQLLIFFSALFGIKLSCILKIEMLNIMNGDQHCESEIDVESEEQVTQRVGCKEPTQSA